jgi:hypothetical protein
MLNLLWLVNADCCLYENSLVLWQLRHLTDIFDLHLGGARGKQRRGLNVQGVCDVDERMEQKLLSTLLDVAD